VCKDREIADSSAHTFSTFVMDRLADPALARIIAEACWFAFEHGRPGYSPTMERKSFMRKYIANRIPTIKLLDEAWAACQAAERDATRSGTLLQASGPEDAQPSVLDLDGLNDDEFDNLCHRTLRKIAVDSRHGTESRSIASEIEAVAGRPTIFRKD
jgi:hypothetical protein